MSAPTAQTDPARLKRLLGFLEQDPANLRLLADAAAAALDAGEAEQASALIARYAALAELPPALVNLQGLIAMAGGLYADAAGIFSALLTTASADANLRFNLAWCRAMTEDFAAVAELVDEHVAAAVPAAAALHVQSLHHLGRLEEALARGMGYAERMPEDTGLMGALALVALDAEDVALARGYAERAGAANADGLSVLGTLKLGEQQLNEALSLFERALTIEADHPRALIGKGLALLAVGRGDDAAAALAQGAERFEDHAGSWLAAGWAALSGGDQAAARSNFQRAVEIDPALADAHGSLAIIDLIEAERGRAAERIDEALRLDAACLPATLAKSMLLAADGDAAGAERVRETALNAAIGPGGETLAKVLAGLGLKPLRQS